jgi:hypothetical protein
MGPSVSICCVIQLAPTEAAPVRRGSCTPSVPDLHPRLQHRVVAPLVPFLHPLGLRPLKLASLWSFATRDAPGSFPSPRALTSPLALPHWLSPKLLTTLLPDVAHLGACNTSRKFSPEASSPVTPVPRLSKSIALPSLGLGTIWLHDSRKYHSGLATPRLPTWGLVTHGAKPPRRLAPTGNTPGLSPHKFAPNRACNPRDFISACLLPEA